MNKNNIYEGLFDLTNEELKEMFTMFKENPDLFPAVDEEEQVQRLCMAVHELENEYDGVLDWTYNDETFTLEILLQDKIYTITDKLCKCTRIKDINELIKNKILNGEYIVRDRYNMNILEYLEKIEKLIEDSTSYICHRCDEIEMKLDKCINEREPDEWYDEDYV